MNKSNCGNIAEHKLLAKYGSVYELAFYINKHYDGLTDQALEPLLFALLAQLLPPDASKEE